MHVMWVREGKQMVYKMELKHLTICIKITTIYDKKDNLGNFFNFIYVVLCLYKSILYYVTLTRNTYNHNVYKFTIIINDNFVTNNSLY